MATELEVTKVLAYMSVYYPAFVFRESTEYAPGTAKAYSMELKEVPYDALNAAARLLVTECKFFPSLSELRGRAFDIMLVKKNLPSAFEAWENLLSMQSGEPIKHVTGEKDERGRWIIETTEREWKHPLIETAARRCGWPNFPDQDSMSYDRDTFMKAYTDECNRANEELRKPEGVKAIENEYLRKQLDAPATVRRLAERMER